MNRINMIVDEDLTNKILQACFEVSNELGSGRSCPSFVNSSR